MASADVGSPRLERRERDGDLEGDRDAGDRPHHRDSERPRNRDSDRDRDRNRDRDRDRTDSYRPARKEQRRPTPPVKTEEEKQAIAKAEYEKLLSMRSGGTYIPPARLRALQSQITDKSSKEYQRLMWEALKKSINGLINKVNYSNIKHIVPELFGENLIKGRGLFCRSIMKAQAASLPFTPVFAAMAAIVNTKLPAVGELLVKRLIISFRKGFKRSDKAVCVSSTTFLAHLINHQVAHERLAGQMLLLLLHKPTDDSVEIAVNFMREVGQHLQDMQPAIALAVWDQLRNVLHEADIDKRVQYMIEVLFQVRKDSFKDNPPIKEELDLVEEEDQITHMVDLDGDIDVQDSLNIFKYDPQWEEHEEAYKKLKAEILGEGSDYDDDDEDDDDESDEEEENEEEKAMEIKDQSNTDLVNLRRTIYLTVMSSIDPEEAVHKLLRVNLPAGQEPELPSMIVEICSQEKTFSKFHGLIGERFAKLNRLWTGLFEESFADYYSKIHRYETNRLRNIARFFAHLLASDAIGWHVLSVIHLNEDETTSSSRIFIKILFQDIAEELGMAKLQARMKDDILQPSFEGLFPRDNARNIRFSINYFTSIGMGALTEASREYLQNMPKPALPAPPAADSDSDSVSSYSSYTGSSYSRSRSRSRTPRRAIDRKHSESRSPSPRGRGRSYSRGRSSTRSRSYSRSVTPPKRGVRRNDSYSASTPRRRGRSVSYSRSPSPARNGPRDRSLSVTPPPPRRAARRSSPSISRSPSLRRGRSASYSASPPPARGSARGRSPRPDPRRAARRNSSSVSSAPRKGARYDSRSPSRASSYDSRSRSPVDRRGPRDRSRSPPPRSRAAPSVSPSPSPPPPRARGARRDDSVSRSPSPPPARKPLKRGSPDDRGRDSRSPAGVKRRRHSDSVSRSRSPPPSKKGRR
ncbi:Putative MIF4G-like, type 3, initiation factor eIF-4 gamma, MA3 [Colletotrichum destructivum]|uniref:Pre-mRNA-splicing factor CWC22 n=1 Tax=Colletotrichum destructivum TaxID=34406 RepID=A0AAX4HYD9_9PEZI|nr:Putative MIF4G-like, type 3, initiation factor eIF-4 gamma, MA3 [Colletotrichum destructivum]